jgi:hypothetical protein
MKKLLISSVIILVSNIIVAQCISGNCENGTGYFKYENGNTYEGYFKNGIKDKLGIYYFKDGATIWGEIKNGKFDGFGAVYWKSGATYIGNLKNGMQEGIGILYDANKAPHSAGTWEAGKLIKPVTPESYKKLDNCIGNCENGFGKLTLPTNINLQGIFENGTLVFGAIQNKEFAYSGNVQNNLANGVGIIEYYNGKKHLGYFKDGKKQGAGIYTKGITLKTYGIWQNDEYKGLVQYYFNPKHFCNELADICGMKSNELSSMNVQTKDPIGNLWSYKFLHRFKIYHSQIAPKNSMLFIDLANTKGVNAKEIQHQLDSCVTIKKIDENSYQLNGANIKLIETDSVLMLQINYPENR